MLLTLSDPKLPGRSQVCFWNWRLGFPSFRWWNSVNFLEETKAMLKGTRGTTLSYLRNLTVEPEEPHSCLKPVDPDYGSTLPWYRRGVSTLSMLSHASLNVDLKNGKRKHILPPPSLKVKSHDIDGGTGMLLVSNSTRKLQTDET